MKINKKLACLFAVFLGLNITACSQQAVQTPTVQNSSAQSLSENHYVFNYRCRLRPCRFPS